MLSFQRLRIHLIALVCLALLVVTPGAWAPAAAQTGARGPIELTITSFAPVNREALREAVNTFTRRNPNVTVRFVDPTPGSSPETMIERSDIVLTTPAFAASLAETGAIRDLGSMRLPTFNRDFETFIDDLTLLHGRRFWIPIDISPTTLTYNPTAWRTYSVPLPPLDWSLQEFEQTLRQLKARGYDSTIQLSVLTDVIIRSYGGTLYDPDTETWRFDDPAVRQGLAHVARLVREGIVSAGPMTMGGSNTAFTLIGGLGLRAGMGPMARHPLPRGPVARATPLSARVAVVTRASAHPEVATALLRELLSDDAQLALARGGVIPLIESPRAWSAWREAVGTQMADVYEVALRGGYISNTPALEQLVNGLQPYFTGARTLDQVLPELMQRLNP